jgi:DNA-binding CsgD family transcriptional regulator
MLLNFILFFSRLFTSHEVVNQIVFVLFDLSYVVFLCLWVSYLGFKSENEKKAPLIAMALAGGVYCLLWNIIFLFFLNENQYIDHRFGQVLACAAEIILLIVALECTWYHFLKHKNKHVLMLLLCLSMSLYFIWYFIYDLDYIFRFIGPPLWSFYPFDAVILLYFILNILIIAYHYPQLWRSAKLHRFSDIDAVIEKIDADSSLTSREKEVLGLMIQGKSNMQIAEELVISVYTVKRHVNNIFRKTDINSRSDLTSIIG